MSVIVIFLAVIAGIAGWWLSQQRLMSKPWLEEGVIGPSFDTGTSLPSAKIGLAVFLAVVGCLFALLTSAYVMRMQLPDWQALPLPQLLWLNTGLLALSSVALHCAVLAVRKGSMETTRLALVTGGLTALAFLFGQVLVCRELVAAGFFLSTNPANSFFYLLTGMHGLHILGGLFGLGRTTVRAWEESKTERVRLGVELCAMYWHFLLLVWLGLLVLLAGWAGDFLEICRGLLS